MSPVTPKVSGSKKIGNISDVTHKSKRVQQLTSQGIFTVNKSSEEELIEELSVVPGTKSIEKKE